MTIIYYIVGGIIYVIGLQSLVKFIVGNLYQKVEKTMDEVEESSDEVTKEFIQKESRPFRLVKEKRKRLWFITTIISLIELIIFWGLTMMLLSGEPRNLYEKVKIISITTSGWLALKIFGNFQQWSGSIFGRATFYIFLIGSVLNIIGAIILGIIIIKIW